MACEPTWSPPPSEFTAFAAAVLPGVSPDYGERHAWDALTAPDYGQVWSCMRSACEYLTSKSRVGRHSLRSGANEMTIVGLLTAQLLPS